MAPGAPDRETEEHRRHGLYAIHGILREILHGNDASFGIAAMIAVESRGDLLLDGRIRQQIAGDLLDREAVERLVAIECVNDPITPSPHVPLRIRLVTIRVGIAGGVEPTDGHLFAIS